MPVARHGVPPDATLDFGQVVDGDAPVQPAAAGHAACPHRLPEGRLLGGRVVERFDNFEVLEVLEREDAVGGAEPRVNATVDELGPQCLAQCDRRGVEAGWTGREGDVVEMHDSFLPDRPHMPDSGGSGRP
jgi:hypothetical protein